MKMLLHAALIFLLTLISLPALAAKVAYSELTGTSGKAMPYGDPIDLYGKLSELRTDDGIPLTEWIKITQLSITYQIPGQGKRTAIARINTAKDEWRALLEPLPQAVYLTLRLDISGHLSNKGIKKVTERLFDDPELHKNIEGLLNSAKGKTPLEVNKLLLDFTIQINAILNRALPSFLEVSQKDNQLPVQAAPSLMTDDRYRKLANIYNELATLRKANRADFLGLPEIALESPSKAYEYLNSIELTGKKKQLTTAFKKDYEAVQSLIEERSRLMLASITIQSELATPVQVEDLLRYAGIDIGAVYAPNINELRQFILINIYFGPVDNRPGTLSDWKNRLSLTVGMESGDLSGNDNSVIKDGKAYNIGLGYRLNKYFRLSAGSMIYRTSGDGSLANDNYYSISMDLTGFKALQGLVSK